MIPPKQLRDIAQTEISPIPQWVSRLSECKLQIRGLWLLVCRSDGMQASLNRTSRVRRAGFDALR